MPASNLLRLSIITFIMLLTACLGAGSSSVSAPTSTTFPSTATISSYVTSAYSLDQINLASDLQALVRSLGSQGYLCSGNEIASVASLKETHVQNYLNSLMSYVQLVKSNNAIDKTAIAALINIHQPDDLDWLASSSTASAMGNCGFSAAEISSTTYSNLIPLYYSNAIAVLNAM